MATRGCSTVLTSLALIFWISISPSHASPPDNRAADVEPVKADECDRCDRMAVVFVHGIGGSAISTWTNTDVDPNPYWPKLLAEDPEIRSDIDIYTVNYNSALLWDKSSIVDIMKDIDLKLDARFFHNRYKKITLICHSMGGIVCTTYLLHVKARYGHRVLSKFRLIIGMAVPNHGSEYANHLGFLRSASARLLVTIEQNDFEQLLEKTAAEILQKQRALHCPLLSIYAGYEKLPLQSWHGLPLRGLPPLKIVSKQSAIAGATKTRGFERDHFTLVEPMGRTDDVYGWVRDDLKACIAGLMVCKGSLDDPEYRDCGKSDDEFPDPDSVADPTEVLFK